MPVLPFAAAALFLIGVSVTGAEKSSVVLWAFTVPFIAAAALCLLWKRIGMHRCRSLRARWLTGLLGLACVGVFVSVPLTHWPFRLAFHLSRPAFDAVAASLESGAQFRQPMRVGFFTIQKAEIYAMNGRICLWTDLDPAGKTGFTQCPPRDVPFNLWSMIELDQAWQYVSED